MAAGLLVILLAGLLALGVAATPVAGQVSLGGQGSLEFRGFLASPLSDIQGRGDLSFSLHPELYFDAEGGRQMFAFEPFVRVDLVDNKRTHVDIRTLSWERAWNKWELRLGIRRVFWGVTESLHLVDVINQTDLVESPDGEEKLGQPMVNLALVNSWGTVDFFALTGFRERTFPGLEGRLRAPFPISTKEAVYESSRGKGRVDWAVRWSHSLGEFDLGLSHFSGTGREPRLVPHIPVWGSPVLVPHYDLIHQTSLDVQWTHGGWLWKFEGLTRRADSRHWAMVGGFEYTLNQVFGGDADLGILSEVLLDSRGNDATTPTQDDLFIGSRLALNDVQNTQILGGAIVDRLSGATLLFLEAQRRIGNGWTLNVESRSFWGMDSGDPLYGLRNDDYLGFSMTRHF
jgi:hypothetical protein